MDHKMKWLLFGGAVLLVLGLFVLGSRMMPTLKNQSAINQIKEAAVSQAEPVKQKKADLKNANLKHIYLILERKEYLIGISIWQEVVSGV